MAGREPPGLTAETLLAAYANGIFPMAEREDDPELFWVDPKLRGVIPLDGFHISRSLARLIRRGRFEVSFDKDFNAVVAGCADREETWINAPLRRLYAELREGGAAHSVEVWSQENLVGGVFGVTLGGAFFGESMFSRQRDASKLALAYLVDHLRCTGFSLFDTQFLTPHLCSLGAVEISREAYHAALADALQRDADFSRIKDAPAPQDVLQRNAQTS